MRCTCNVGFAPSFSDDSFGTGYVCDRRHLGVRKIHKRLQIPCSVEVEKSQSPLVTAIVSAITTEPSAITAYEEGQLGGSASTK